MTEPQTVEKEADTLVKPVDEVVVDAQKTDDNSGEFDLDSLLSEWEKEEPKVEAPLKTEDEKPVDSTKEILEYVKAQKARDDESLKTRAAEEYKKTVQAVKGDMKVSDKIVDGWLQAMASSNKQIAKAYVERDKKPETWAKVEKSLQMELRKELNAMPDKASTETREKIATAIQNAQSTNYTAEQTKLGDMDDNQFQSFINNLPSS